MTKKRIFLVTIFLLLTVLSLIIGPNMKLITQLFTGNKRAWIDFLNGRLPRTIVIILASASLSISGLIMQSISRNKFISPSTAGVNDAAALGVFLGYLLLGNQPLGIRFIFAFIFASISSLLFIAILNKIKFKNVIYVPLIGMMYGALISSLTTFIAHRTNNLQFLTSINVGTFSKITALNSYLLIILVPALILSFIYAASFNVVAMGNDFAKNLGVNYKLIMTIGIIIISIVSASTYIVVGPLPFLGLIIPNIVTLYYGDGVKKNLVDVALFGISFVLLNDIISRLVVYPYEIAVGFTMGISGAIIFLILIFKRVKTNE